MGFSHRPKAPPRDWKGSDKHAPRVVVAVAIAFAVAFAFALLFSCHPSPQAEDLLLPFYLAFIVVIP
jgi:hypothetical protein